MSSFLTEDQVWEIVDSVVPVALSSATQIGDSTRMACHVTVALLSGKRQRKGYQDCKIYDQAFGDTDGKPYGIIADGKCELAWTYEKNTHVLLLENPHLGEPGNPKYQGGVCYRYIAVGVSGLEAPLDEMVAMWIATALVAKAQLMMNELMADKNARYFPEVQAAA